MQEGDGGGPHPLEQGGLDLHPGDPARGVRVGNCGLLFHVLSSGKKLWDKFLFLFTQILITGKVNPFS